MLVAKIIAESGSIELVGYDTSERFTRTLVADTGAFVIGGGTGTIEGPGDVITADSGWFVLTGNDSTVVDGSPFLCETGSFSLTGNDIHQSVSQPAASGSFAIAVNDANFVVQLNFNCESGMFILSGKTASITVNNAGAAKHLYYHFFIRS